MESKIIQLQSTDKFLFALDNDGKIYRRALSGISAWEEYDGPTFFIKKEDQGQVISKRGTEVDGEEAKAEIVTEENTDENI